MNKKGFTLIELLVVIAIIGLLSTLAVVSLNNARAKARDARRTSDMKSMQSAMELYKADNNDQLNGIDITSLASWSDLNTSLQTYLPAGVPVDPAQAASHYILCINGNNYLLQAVLESTASSGGVTAATNYADTDCIADNATAAGAAGNGVDGAGEPEIPDCDAAGEGDFCLGNPDGTA